MAAIFQLNLLLGTATTPLAATAIGTATDDMGNAVAADTPKLADVNTAINALRTRLNEISTTVAAGTCPT